MMDSLLNLVPYPIALNRPTPPIKTKQTKKTLAKQETTLAKQETTSGHSDFATSTVYTVDARYLDQPRDW